jgi:hypothetical protein|tara:strand:+ start:13059 stop:13235 length:177 start_codon:yes stop_codon:yes gene_type:complete
VAELALERPFLGVASFMANAVLGSIEYFAAVRAFVELAHTPTWRKRYGRGCDDHWKKK